MAVNTELQEWRHGGARVIVGRQFILVIKLRRHLKDNAVNFK